MNKNLITVIIPTYNPDFMRLSKTLNALSKQTLNKKLWEIILVDNNSTNGIISKILNDNNYNNIKVINESKQGLTWARKSGVALATSDILIFVDDDNILNENYLDIALKIMKNNESLGCIGGSIIGKYEIQPPSYISEIESLLAVRSYGNYPLIFNLDLSKDSKVNYPVFAPIGAGMVIQKKALENYIKGIENGVALIQDRTGSNLSSGGDNDIVLHVLKSGFAVGYYPELTLEHIIPAGRLQPSYLAELNRASSKSWVLLLNKHNILPWKPIPPYTLPLRKLKSFLKNKAWQGQLNMILWKGSCGTFEGLADIYAKRN